VSEAAGDLTSPSASLVVFLNSCSRSLMRVFVSIMSVAGLFAAGAPQSAIAQNGEALRVFLDCQSFHCDFDHLRREIGFVNWVRDREVAEVHILGTSRGTGGGGREVTLALIGRDRFAGRADTLQFITNATDTGAEERDALTHTLQLALARFAVGTPLARRITVAYDAPAAGDAVAQPDDPWNYWVFETNVGGSLRGEQRVRNYASNGRIQARRVTEEWKIFVSSRGSYRRNETVLDSTDANGDVIVTAGGDTLTSTFVDERTDYGISVFSVWSLGPHWSAGGVAELSSSTFSNERLALEGGTAIEYSLFPYAESTRRSIVFQYTIGVSYFDWEKETIFGRGSETRPAHEFEVAVGAQQPWGNVFAEASASQYLDHLAQHRIDVFGGFSIRLFRGLRLNLSGNVARVKDQINLAAGDLTAADILVQRRELGTEFEYRTNLSFSYTFGSIFNNIVNPRF